MDIKILKFREKLLELTAKKIVVILTCVLGFSGMWGKAVAHESQDSPAILIQWKGHSSGENLLDLPQIQALASERYLVQSVQRAEQVLLLNLVQGIGNHTSLGAGKHHILNRDFIFGIWPEGSNKGALDGWFLAVRQTGDIHPLISGTADGLGISIPELLTEKNEKKHPAGVTRTKAVGDYTWKIGRYADWLHLSSFRTSSMGDSIPELSIVDLIKNSRRAIKAGEILKLDAELARLDCLDDQLAGVIEHSLPNISLVGSINKENIRLDGDMIFESAPGIKLSDWRLPVSTMRDPITSFTAVRGVKNLLRNLGKKSGISFPKADQIISAGEYHGNLNFVMRWFIPVENHLKSFDKSQKSLSEKIEAFLETVPFGELKLHEGEPRLSWAGLPIVVPYIVGLNLEKEGDFLEFGFLPLKAEIKPVPQELLDQVLKSENVIMYDWELTSQRIQQLNSLFNIWEILSYTAKIKDLPKSNSAGSGAAASNLPQPPKPKEAQAIIKALAGPTGNTVTQISEVSPTQWKFQRTGKIGISAYEILFLSRFLSSMAAPAPVVVPVP